MENSMYSNKFVLSIVQNGQVQKELANGTVPIAFDYYSVRFRNKHNRRAVVKLYIDGEKMCRGGFVIPANSYREVDCSSQTLKKFKFVELQSVEAQDHGKDQVNADKKMGVVEAHYFLEKQQPPPPTTTHIYHHHHTYTDPWWNVKQYGYDPNSAIIGLNSNKLSDSPKPMAETFMSSSSGHTLDDVVLDSYYCDDELLMKDCEATPSNLMEGATVPGETSSMKFGSLNVDVEDTATVLKLYLQGYYLEAKSVDMKYCDKCGAKMLKKSSNFCHHCGNKF